MINNLFDTDQILMFFVFVLSGSRKKYLASEEPSIKHNRTTLILKRKLIKGQRVMIVLVVLIVVI